MDVHEVELLLASLAGLPDYEQKRVLLNTLQHVASSEISSLMETFDFVTLQQIVESFTSENELVQFAHQFHRLREGSHFSFETLQLSTLKKIVSRLPTDSYTPSEWLKYYNEVLGCSSFYHQPTGLRYTPSSSRVQDARKLSMETVLPVEISNTVELAEDVGRKRSRSDAFKRSGGALLLAPPLPRSPSLPNLAISSPTRIPTAPPLPTSTPSSRLGTHVASPPPLFARSAEAQPLEGSNNSSNTTCFVCYDDFHVDQLFSCPAFACNLSCCHNCMKTWLEARVHHEFTCMGCAYRLPDETAAQFVSEQKMRLRQYLRERRLHEDSDDVLFCSNLDCRAMISGVRELKKLGKPRFATCNECSTSVCLRCEETYESKHRCADRRVEVFGIRSSLWKLFNTKSCPSCGAEIQKNGGCSHMTCSHCSAYFCWKCKGVLSGSRSGRRCKCLFDHNSHLSLEVLAYSGIVLGVTAISPLIITAAVVAGPIYGIHKLNRKRNQRRRPLLYR